MPGHDKKKATNKRASDKGTKAGGNKTGPTSIAKRPKRQAAQRFLSDIELARNEKKDLEEAVKASLTEAALKTVRVNKTTTSKAGPSSSSTNKERNLKRTESHTPPNDKTKGKGKVAKEVTKVKASKSEKKAEANSAAKRPKREASQRVLYTTEIELARSEQKDLEKAIKASLTEVSAKSASGSQGSTNKAGPSSTSADKDRNSKNVGKQKKDALSKKLTKPDPHDSKEEEDPSINSGDNFMKRPKIPPQRKFAQGTRNHTPVTTPVKTGTSTSAPKEILKEFKTTNSFLSFLSFRGIPKETDLARRNHSHSDNSTDATN